ncbi:unnamed protein product [Rotaria sp. Silwood2]|nr:unnamed protein product [Rotaria sp. Silwood2]CAF2765870.1 unnamed protein product [Rotaria sp. Silwood2]CAF3077696.1 unnamed protein product [Rotaria sp. Silwood2]CAF3179731.1 unnamed protein product [Rotaria sp. Silwood2]CAF4370442.1 unnamed protein product [Rotaria sp. Silwood2]
MDLNGYQWEQIITDSLPKLKVFQWKTRIVLDNYTNKEQQINHVIDSFRSSFWIDKHQWFVRCHSDSAFQSNILWLYTLPYTFDDFSTTIINALFRSTCPPENDFHSYDYVNRFTYESSKTQECASFHIKFVNIHHLLLEHRPTYHFWSIIPTLDHLISLEIFLHDDIDDTIYVLLQDLLDRAPRLYSLKFRSWSYLPIFLAESKTHSIRRIDLQGSDRSYREMWFSEDECGRLCRSTLGIQCEVLFIRVKHRQSILDLVNRMCNLRALNIQCQENQLDEFNGLSLSRDEELVKWLEHQLPPTWKIGKDPRWHHSIQMWIR